MSAIAQDIKPGTGATTRLAEHVASKRYEDLDPKVVHAFKRLLEMVWGFDGAPDLSELYKW